MLGSHGHLLDTFPTTVTGRESDGSFGAGKGRDRDRPAGQGEQPLIIGIEPESRGFVDDAAGFLDSSGGRKTRCSGDGLRPRPPAAAVKAGEDLDEFLVKLAITHDFLNRLPFASCPLPACLPSWRDLHFCPLQTGAGPIPFLR